MTILAHNSLTKAPKWKTIYSTVFFVQNHELLLQKAGKKRSEFNKFTTIIKKNQAQFQSGSK